MDKPEQKHGFSERRKFDRLSVYSFMHATATLWDSVKAQQANNEEDDESWTGLLEDVSSNGAQIIVPKSCGEHLNENQDVMMRIKTTFIEDVNIDVAAQIKYIVPARNHNGMQVGIEFTAMDRNPQAKEALLRICEYGRKLEAVSAQQAEQMTVRKTDD